MDSSANRIYAPFFSSAFTWNFALGMTQLQIPLYARELGYSGVEIGSLIALPIVAQMIFNLVGGAWTDRLGGMNVSLVAFVATAAAGTMFAASSSFAGLFAAQIMMIVARAVYWPASWALVSQLPGARGSLMGTLNAITSFGQIAGTVCAGMIIASWGFGTGFWTVAAMGAVLAAPLCWATNFLRLDRSAMYSRASLVSRLRSSPWNTAFLTIRQITRGRKKYSP